MSRNWFHKINPLYRHKSLVLMYHRIADAAVDPWQLCVSQENFAQQIAVLKKELPVIPVSALLKNVRQKKCAATTACITFDDGYTDNFLCARPVLEKHQCPATFFIPSRFTGQLQPFWWDDLEAIILSAPQLPQLFQMPIQDEMVDVDLEDETGITDSLVAKHQAWHWPAPPPTRRSALFLKIWELLKPMPQSEIETTLTALKNWAGFAPAFTEALLPLHHEQLKIIAQNPLFEIGLHTATHPALAYHPEDVQYHEIAENKKALQAYSPVNAIAFPYGNYNNTTLAVLQRQDIDAGFTTEEKPVTSGANPYCLGRFQVKNWTGAEFAKHLHHWLKK